MKGYRMRNTKGFSFWKVIGVDHPISLLNQVSLFFSNSCKLSVACKDFTTTQSLTIVRVRGSYQCLTNVIKLCR